MLETTMASKFVVGSNVKGQVSGANWMFLLPSLQLRQVVCIGALPLTTLTPLCRFAEQVWVVSDSTVELDRVVEVHRHTLPANLLLYHLENRARLPFPSQTADLIVIAGANGINRLDRYPALLPEIRRVLHPNGSLYLEAKNRFGARPKKRWFEEIREYFGGAQVFWLTPADGEMQTAVPSNDWKAKNYFLEHGLGRPSITLAGLGRLQHAVNKNRFILQLTSRYGILAHCGVGRTSHVPPAYLRDMMKAVGLEQGEHGWGLSAPGLYNSRKVLLYLFNQTDGAPEYIVKLTRDPELNPRLDNERRSLETLYEKGIGDSETVPRVVFHGEHAGLAVVGETIIQGAPFRGRSRATPDCSCARGAVEWLTDLGARTSSASPATPKEVGRQLRILCDRFRQFYNLTVEQHQFLINEIALVENRVGPFPLVFQHGDPGIWNILVTPTGRVAFVDWEAAETQGMPLWDLFYFLRSYCTWVARRRGIRNGLKGFRQLFLASSSLSPLVVQATKHYCERIGLSEELIEPLFYTCWMHRALKEATRLVADHLEEGHYVNLLRLCIDDYDAPTLRRLFSVHSA